MALLFSCSADGDECLIPAAHGCHHVVPSSALQAETGVRSLTSYLSKLRAGHLRPHLGICTHTKQVPRPRRLLPPTPGASHSLCSSLLTTHTHTCTPVCHSSGGSAQKLISKWMISNTQSFPKASLPKTTSFTQMADILVSTLINTHTFTAFCFDNKSNLHGCRG